MHTREGSTPPWTTEVIDATARDALLDPHHYAHIVNPPGGDNEVLHVIHRGIPRDNPDEQPQRLLVIGSKHRSAPEHWYYGLYRAFMERWRRHTDPLNRIIIREGAFSFWGGLGVGQDEIDPASYIAQASDGGLASAFARAHGIPIVSGDFPYYGDIAAQCELHPDRIEEIITYYAMREIPIFARMAKSGVSFEAFFRQRLEILQRNMGKLAITRFIPDTLDFSHDTVFDLHKKFFGQEPTPELAETYIRYTSAHLEDEAFREQKVARIAVDRMRLSDAHLVRTIDYQLGLNRDVLTIFGNHHTLAISRAFGTLGEAAPLLPSYLSGVSFGDIKAQANYIKQFEGGVLVYPPDEPPQYYRPPEVLNKPTDDDMSSFMHVWPSLISSPHGPFVITNARLESMRNVVKNEISKSVQGYSNWYVDMLCKEPIVWENDLLELFHILEHEGEVIRGDIHMFGRDTGDGSKMVQPLVEVLTNALWRLWEATNATDDDEAELYDWFMRHGKIIGDRCIAEGLASAQYIADKVNVITKQVAGLCRLLRSSPAFLDIGFSPMEQCSYALGFLHLATLKEFWPLKRLERIIPLPYHILPVYRDSGRDPFKLPVH